MRLSTPQRYISAIFSKQIGTNGIQLALPTENEELVKVAHPCFTRIYLGELLHSYEKRLAFL